MSKTLKNIVIFILILTIPILIVNYFKIKSENSDLKYKIEGQLNETIKKKNSEIKSLKNKIFIWNQTINNLENSTNKYNSAIDSLKLIKMKNNINFEKELIKLKSITSNELLNYWKEKFAEDEKLND